MSEHPTVCTGSTVPRLGRRAHRTAAVVAVLVGLGLLTGVPAGAQDVGEPLGPGGTSSTSSTTTTTVVEQPTTTSDDKEEPATTAPEASEDEPSGTARAAATDVDDDGGTSFVALLAAGVVGLVVGLALAGLPLLAALSRRKAASTGARPGPPAAPAAPVPTAAPTPPVGGGPVIGAPPARDSDQVRGQRVALVEAMIGLRDKLPSEALGTEVVEALAAAGITEVRPEGEPFDPARHRAVHQVATDDPSRHGTIASVERPGYTDGSTMIRQPEVVVLVHGGSS